MLSCPYKRNPQSFLRFQPNGKETPRKSPVTVPSLSDHRRNACCHYGIQKRKSSCWYLTPSKSSLIFFSAILLLWLQRNRPPLPQCLALDPCSSAEPAVNSSTPALQKGATAKVYHEPLQWLISAGLAIPCQTAICSRPSETSLHLYPVDTGLCSCILKIPAFQLLSGEETTAGTACIETFLAQHFIRNGYALSYWSSGNQAEVPFLLSKTVILLP